MSEPLTFLKLTLPVTEKEAEWLQRAVKALCHWAGSYAGDEDSQITDAAVTLLLAAQLDPKRLLDEWGGEYYEAADFDFEVKTTPEGVRKAVFSIDHQGTAMAVCYFLREFLLACRPDGQVRVSWAETSDNNEEDCNGGGTALVTAQKVHLVSTFDDGLFEKVSTS